MPSLAEIRNIVESDLRQQVGASGNILAPEVIDRFVRLVDETLASYPLYQRQVIFQSVDGVADYPLPHDATGILDIMFDTTFLSQMNQRWMTQKNANWRVMAKCDPGMVPLYAVSPTGNRTVSLYRAPETVVDVTANLVVKPYGVPVTTMTRLTGSVTVETAEEHYMLVDDILAIHGTVNFDGTGFVVDTVPDGTHFTYTEAGADITEASVGYVGYDGGVHLLVVDTDIPFIPDHFHQLYVEGAIALMCEKRLSGLDGENPRYQAALARYGALMKEFERYVVDLGLVPKGLI